MWPSGISNFGNGFLTFSSFRLQRSAIPTVRLTTCSAPLKTFFISSAVFTKNWLVANFIRLVSWIDLPVLDDHGYPVHDRGRTVAEPGLWFAGLHFLYAMSSAMVHGVGRDAERIAAAIAGSPAQSGPASAPPRRALAEVLPDARA